MILRDYQQTLHDEIYAAWDACHQNVLAVLPTGGGKTVTFAHIVKEEPGASVVLAHRVSWSLKCRWHWLGRTCGTG